MKLIKNFRKKVGEMSVQCALLLSGIITGLIIGLSILLTAMIFFSGDNNRQKTTAEDPNINNPTQPRTLTPEQIQQMREAQRQKVLQQKMEEDAKQQELIDENSSDTE